MISAGLDGVLHWAFVKSQTAQREIHMAIEMGINEQDRAEIVEGLSRLISEAAANAAASVSAQATGSTYS